MKKWMAAVLTLALCLGLAACGGKFADLVLDVPGMEVTSASIGADGSLPLVCAADKQRNDPPGQNQSPQLSWQTVEGASGYVVVMVDEDANWLHWLMPLQAETELAQGACTETDVYVGPYPPKFGGVHHYRVEVFALAQAPDATEGKLDAAGSYAKLVESLDTAEGARGNVVARGQIVGTYAN